VNGGRDPRPPRIGVRIALAGASLLLTLAALETATRLLLPPTRYHDSPLEYDPVLGFRGVLNRRYVAEGDDGPHEFVLNADGLRGRELPTGPAAAGTQRIAFLGDSFLVGERVPDEALMTTRLEAALREAGRPHEIYNLSIIDAGTAQQILLLDRVAPRIRPDVVVLALYTGNDIVNNSLLLSSTTRVSPGDPIRAYLVPEQGGLRHTWADPLRGWLRSHSRLFTTLERRLLSSMEWTLPEARSVRERLLGGLAPREHMEIFRRHDPGHRWEQAWRTTFDLLRVLRDRVDALGARFLVLVIPSGHQVEHGPQGVRYDAEARAFAGRPLDRILDWNLPERRLSAFLQGEGIEVRLLLDELRSAAREQRVYSQDQHLNARGHEVAAGVVARWLAGEAAAPPEAPGGEPVHLLRASGHPRQRLDFRQAPHRGVLGDGWLFWQPPGAEGVPGWRVGASALLALPAARGELVVRGVVPDAASLPVEGTLALIGGPRGHFTLSEHGAFALRLPWSPGQGGVDGAGYAAVMIAPGTTHMLHGLPVGFIVQQVAFE
jgi:hypothetical protein